MGDSHRQRGDQRRGPAATVVMARAERLEADAEVVRDLLAAQHPDLADLPLHPASPGWANKLWRLGDELAVRLPTVPNAVPALRAEQRWLPELAPSLPLPVPEVLRTGEPGGRYPFPWSITTWVHGMPADRSPVSDGPDGAKALAGFLTALHTPAPDGAPVNPARGMPLADVADHVEPHLARLSDGGPGGGAAGADVVQEIWSDALDAPAWVGPPMWLHGDLHPANVVTDGATLTGIIDFGDMGVGDPAWDVAAAWTLLPSGADAAFFDLYRADAATVRRARGLALLRAAALLEIGRAGELGQPGGKVTWGPAGRATLTRVLVSMNGDSH